MLLVIPVMTVHKVVVDDHQYEEDPLVLATWYTSTDTTFAQSSSEYTGSFPTPSAVDASGFHELIHNSTKRLLVHELSPDHQRLLPQQQTDIWSLLDRTIHDSRDVPVSLSSLRDVVKDHILAATAGIGYKDMSAEDIIRDFTAKKPTWHDAAGFVYRYLDLVDDPAVPSSVEYSRKIFLGNMDYPFPLQRWWQYHRQTGCQDCMRHLAAHGMKELPALCDNHSNPCWFSDILCWLSGGWRIPLKEQPSPNHHDNHPSLMWSVDSMRPEIARMIDHGVLVEGNPVLTNPGMAVVRESELAERCRVLDEMGHPSPSRAEKDIDSINRHIRSFLETGVEVPAEIGELKPVKLRYCLDLSILLNGKTKRWDFSYAKVRDAIALLKHQGFMAKIDLER